MSLVGGGVTELHVRAVSARNLKDTQTFGTQDPFCTLTLGNRSFKTRVHDNGGIAPVWNEKFVFELYDHSLDQLIIQVKNKNFTDSKLIGECRLQVSMFSHGNVSDQWYALNKGNKRTGDINLRVQMLGPGIGSKGSKQQYAQQAPYGQPAPQQQGYAQPPPQQYGQPSYPQPQYGQQQPPPAYAQPQYAQAQHAPSAPPPQPNVNGQLAQQNAAQQGAIAAQQQQIQMQQQQIQQQQAQLQYQQRQQYARPPPVVVAPPPHPVVVQQPVYAAPPPVIVQQQPTVVYGGHRGYGGAGVGVAAGAGLGLAGGLLLGAALSDDGPFDDGGFDDGFCDWD